MTGPDPAAPRVCFWGVRGSFPLARPQNRRYGSNTSSASLHVPGQPLVLLDLGTGLALLHDALAEEGAPRPLVAAALVTHLHLDHLQGLPFFDPVHERGTCLDVYAPRQASASLESSVGRLVGPPLFPLPLDQLAADVRFHEVHRDRFPIGALRVTVRPVPHLGPTVGYRVDGDGFSVAYVSDHQQPGDAAVVDEGVLELAEGVDLLVHEAQYSAAELDLRPDWGHCTVDYAVEVARQSGARALCLFHHDPRRDDDSLDALLAGARHAAGTGFDVVAAFEGMTITL
ncbi:MAG: MBL fold metallo-hydrolase [Acidimicrobiales bacterium]